MVRFYVRWHLDVGMVQQQKRIDLLHLLCRQRLANGHSTHVHLFCIQ